MFKKRLLSAIAVLACGIAANAITCTYEVYDEAKKTCAITGWTGDAPTGSWTIPSSASINGTKYTIISIKPHALDNMPEVTQVNIPASITIIGHNGGESGGAGGAENFYGFPKLQKFAVNSENPNFKADGLGCLVTKNTDILVKVPQAVIVTSTSFIVSNSSIAEDAFAENSKIGSITLGGSESFYGNPGFNTMKSLTEFIVTRSNGKLKADNGILYSQDGKELRFCPPRKMLTSFALSSTVSQIGDYAFAGCIYLSSFSSMPTQALTLGKAAFAGSGLQSININEKVTLSDEGYTFYKCSSLQTITFNGDINVIPSHFAANCPKLTTVNYRKNSPTILKTGAFKNCTSLVNYPFSASYYAQYDSVFANIGVTDLVYNNAAPSSVSGADSGWYTFTDCANLTTIDLMNIDITNRAYTIAHNFASDCPKLKEVYLPRLSNFSVRLITDNYYFGDGSNLDKIALGSYITINKEPIFVYSGNQTFEPTIYLRRDLQGRGQYYTVADAIQLKNGAKLKPTFFIETLTPPDLYLYSGATYYVPALARENYSSVTTVNGVIKTMFTLSVIKQNDEVCFFVVTGLDGRITIDKVVTGNKTFEMPEAAIISTGLSQDQFKEITVYYTVDNVEMQTTYPYDMFFQTGVEGVETDNADSDAPRYFDLQGREVANPSRGNLYIVRQGNQTTKVVF